MERQRVGMLSPGELVNATHEPLVQWVSHQRAGNRPPSISADVFDQDDTLRVGSPRASELPAIGRPGKRENSLFTEVGELAARSPAKGLDSDVRNSPDGLDVSYRLAVSGPTRSIPLIGDRSRNIEPAQWCSAFCGENRQPPH